MVGLISAIVLLSAAVLPLAAQEAAGYKQEYLGEWNSTGKHAAALAQAIPAEKFAWRPADGVRSVSEVFVHIAAGNFLLLDIVGQPVPAEFYGKVDAAGSSRPMAIIKRNMELEATVKEKERVAGLLQQSLDAVRKSFDQASAADLERRVNFFGRQVTVREVYLRALAHLNEHTGQMIAYARMNGVTPPWSRSAPAK